MNERAGLSPDEAAIAARATEQVRLRKERREAKIRAGGSARLNKITGLGGGIPRVSSTSPPTTSTPDTAPLPAEATAEADQQQQQHAADPEEVDIAQHYYRAEGTNRARPPFLVPGQHEAAVRQDDVLRPMILGLDRSASPLPPDPFATSGGPGSGEDAVASMLSQLLGPGAPGLGQVGAGGPGASSSSKNNSNNDNNNPFAAVGVNSLLGTGRPAPLPPRNVVAWRVVHFLLAAGLGLYVALVTDFGGTKIERERGAFSSATGQDDEDDDRRRYYFFWTFATAEAMLLTTRFLLDRAWLAPSGVVWMVVGFLPDGKFKYMANTCLRYGQILSTVRSDILMSVLVLGLCSSLRHS